MPVFRFKLNPELLNKMHEFAKIHRYDDRETFKESFDDWKRDNKSDIDQETVRLQKLGYDNDICDKIYRSIRYYFRKQYLPTSDDNKKDANNVKKTYVRIPKMIIDGMDEYIKEHNNEKPSNAFDNFISVMERSEDLREELNNISDIRLKKAFKNRHYIITKSK